MFVLDIIEYLIRVIYLSIIKMLSNFKYNRISPTSQSDLTPQPPSLRGKGEQDLLPSPCRRGAGGEVKHNITTDPTNEQPITEKRRTS